MPTAEYYQKQVELLLLWAAATTNRDMQFKLIQRAREFLVLANCTEETLRQFQRVLESVLHNNSPSSQT